jgi:hypothetical protein
VFSKTHREIDDRAWLTLNTAFHEQMDLMDVKSGKRRPPPYFEQAAMLNILSKNRIVNLGNSLDWGGGYSTLSKVAHKYHDLKIKSYDKYMPSKRKGYFAKEISGRKFRAVISSAVVEHMTTRVELDELNSYVSDDGCLILHTLVTEKIPKDPTWFYLLPVHAAFYSNRSMSLLMGQWGYNSSIYCPPAKTWVWFKSPPKSVKSKVKTINAELLSEYLFFKRGFVDYWK